MRDYQIVQVGQHLICNKKLIIILLFNYYWMSNSISAEKLFLTPLLREGRIEEAKEMSRVNRNLCPDCDSIESYSGFITVNSTYNKNLFFYFVPALNRTKDTPIMIWMNGGPGSSSMLALFLEHGPFYVDEKLELKPRKITWTTIMSIIYVDNPVGAGFSFTDSSAGLPRTTDDCVDELYSLLVQFLQIFYEYQPNEFLVGGQSYAGKYGPALAHKIHESNQNNPVIKINLKGLAIGSGFFDPRNQLDYASFYYNTGLIDEYEHAYFQQQEEITRNFIDEKNWTQAFIVLESLIIGYPTPGGTSHFQQVTGLEYNLNMGLNKEPEENHRFQTFLNQDHVRKALHVGDTQFNKFNADVYNNMKDDIYQSVRQKFVDLLNADYKILVYSSQFDAIVPYTTINSFVNSLTNSSWKLATDYTKAERTIWRVGNDQVAGYLKSIRNFTFALIRNCGHLASTDQPVWSFELMNKFVNK